jgi:acetyl esterase/lipase
LGRALEEIGETGANAAAHRAARRAPKTWSQSLVAAAKTTYNYKTIGDCQLQLDVYAPDDPRPTGVIVWFHGGAVIMGSREGMPADQRDRYLAAGYAVVAADYRLVPETKLPAIIEDVRDACRWVREAGPKVIGADPAHMAAVGHSAGGYLALMAGYCADPPLQAVVSFYGYGDIVAPWYSQPDPHYCRQPAMTKEEAYRAIGEPCPARAASQPDRHRFYLYCRQQGLWPNEAMGRDPHAEPEAFEAFCPVRNVTRSYPPTMLLHGDRDADVPHSQSLAMAEALASAGVEHELITIPGGDHGFDAGDHPMVPEAFSRTLAFLGKHVR